MNITSSGRLLGTYPKFKLSDGEGVYLCNLSRIDVSDVRNTPVAEAFYTPLLKIDARDGMTTYELRLIGSRIDVWVVTQRNRFMKRINHYGFNQLGHPTSEE